MSYEGRSKCPARRAAILGPLLFLAVSLAGAGEAEHTEVTGTLKPVDVRSRTITVETHSGTRIFQVDKSSIMAQDTGRRLTLGDLRAGERVRVHYVTAGQDRLASQIEVLSQHVR